MIRLSEQARPVDRRRENRPGRLTALLGAAVLVAAVPALAASHGGGGHSGGGHSGGGGGMRSMSSGPSGGSHGSGGGHGTGGNHGGTGGYHGGTGGYHGGTGGYHGGGGYYGGYRGGYHGYYGGFRGYYGFHNYFFPRFYFTWGTPFFWGFPYDYWPYYGYGGYGWDGYYGYPPYYSYDRVRHQEQGALDLDLSPADTQVFLDGQYIGTVDDFDGWPQYLWLDPGTYDIVFYREGYKTLARQVTIYRGLVVDWTDHLEQGPSIRPEDLPTKSHERRDARLRQDREMQDRAERYQRDRDRYDGDRDGGWRDRADRDRDMRRRDADRDDDDRPPADVRGGRHEGRLRLDVRPGDASVYLDGRFVGTAEEVAQGGGLAVSPGNHTLSIVRPGRRAEERRFNARSGEDTTLSIDLQNQ